MNINAYGNLRGDNPAAGRYLMARMSEYTIDCFFDDFEHYCIPMKQTYDGSTFEPEFLKKNHYRVIDNEKQSELLGSLTETISSQYL